MPRANEKRAVIFDFDGTLLDSIPDLILANQRAAVALRLRIPTGREFRALMAQSFGYAEIVTHLWPGEDVPAIQKKAYAETEKARLREIPGARRTVSALRERGVSLALHTNRESQASLIHDLERAGFRTDDFHVIHTRDESEVPKPDPRALKTLLSRLVTADLLSTMEHSYVVSDATGDACMAISCGCQFIGVLTGAATEENFGSLRAHPAVTIVPSVTDVPKVLFPW